MKQKQLSWLFLFTLIVITVACHNYFKVTQAKAGTSAEKYASTDSLHLLNRYFILRCNGRAYAMYMTELSKDRKSASCTLEQLGNNHLLYTEYGTTMNMKYKKSSPEQSGVLSEVHFYVSDDPDVKVGPYTLQLDKVTKIEVLEFDKKRTTNSYVIGAVGYTLGGMALAAIIIAATKSSCPFVSAYHDNDFALQGELYGGAIYPQLARHDYLPLQITPEANDLLRIKISNELKERQFTDLADLWVINHPAGTKVLADETGNLYCIAQPRTAFRALFEDNKEVTSEINTANDNKLLYFDDTSRAINQVRLQFHKPDAEKNGLLQLTLKNSYWLDYLYGELAKGFGSSYASYVQQQRTKPATELKKWVTEQSIPLRVEVKTPTGWKEAARISTTGPLATREIVIPLDLSQSPGTEVEVRLSCGFMFWEIDYAAMDFSGGKSFTMQVLHPIKAVDENGKDQLSVLQQEDGLYLEQPQIGNVATITYKAAPQVASSMVQSYILHSKGYYEHIRDFTGNPNLAFLQQFRNPDAFPAFGASLYKKISHDSWNQMASIQQ
jgi:hypothetical protein